MAFAIASLCSMVLWLLAEQVGFLHVDGAEGLVDGEHDGEPDGRLGRGQHDHEDREHLPGDLSGALHVMIEGDEVHVGGVEDQLDAHQDPHRVAPGDHRHHAEREQRRADDEEMGQADARHSSTVSECSLISLRAMITAPTSAASSTTEATSNGSRKSVRKAVPSAALSGSYEGTGTVFHGDITAMYESVPTVTAASAAPTGNPRCALVSLGASPICLVSMMAKRISTRMPPTEIITCATARKSAPRK